MIRTLILSFLTMLALGPAVLNAQTDQPQTVAETSEFKSTSTSAQVLEFIEWCDKKSENVRAFQFGTTVEGRKMMAVEIGTPSPDADRQDDRARVMVIGNIHSGECCGKEALLIMLRELTHDSDHRWLKNMRIVFVPNYSADANDRMGKNNRPGQGGPENGMGRRENAQGLDLNRDFVKIDSPEARAMVKLIDQFNPHLFVDCHTTNGSRHRYALTYDIPHNPSSPELVRNFLRQKMMPKLTEQMAAVGTNTFYYGNFNRDNTRWTSFGHEPRYSTEYVGLRGRLAILSEAYSYISFKERIEATQLFVSTILDYVANNAAAIDELLNAVDSDQEKDSTRVPLAIGARVTKFDKKFKLLGFKDDKPHDFECEFVGNYVATKTTSMPNAYLIPAELSRVADRLLMHGIAVQKMEKETELSVEVDTVLSADRATRAFQEHKMMRVTTERSQEKVTFPAGTLVVPTNQPLGRLAAYLLEAESDDGLTFWNFLDRQLVVGQPYPIKRLVQDGNELPFQSSAVEAIEPLTQLTLADIDGPDQLLNDYPKAPQWQGKTNLIQSQTWGRNLLVDAESVSFIDQPRTDRRALLARMSELDLEKDLIRELSDKLILTSDDQKTKVHQASEHTIVIRGEVARMIGTPESPADLIHFNHDASKLVYHANGGLNFLDLDSNQIRSIKQDVETTFIGKLDWVYQEELYGRGNFKGYWLSPNGPNVAYLELDESPVHAFTVVDHLPVRGELELTNYPKAGDPLPKVRVAVADTNKAKPVYVDLSQYQGTEILISRVSWTADGTKILIQVQNREQTWLDLIATNADGSNPRKMFRDQTEAWIESPGAPNFLADGSFIWPSARSGYRHLYRYSAEGELVAQMTDGKWEVRSFLGIDPQREYAYFTATRESPRDLDAYRIKLPNGEVEKITSGSGTHEVDFSHDYTYFIDTFSTVDTPAKYRLHKNDGTFLRQLNESVDDRLSYLAMAEPEFVEVPSANDQPMDAMILRPPNFDATKKYPVMIHIYGGPQTPRVRNRFGGDWYLWHQMLAQQGYVVWIFDNQSSSYRSQKNAWPIHNNLAEGELADIERGVNWLKSKPWVDAERIGLWGWSYGGYMTAYAMTHSKSFKMGISGAPVTDWKNYDAIYTERYMGTPQNNPEGYQSTSVLPAAKDLHGKMMIIHGTIDDNVHLSNTMQLVYELQKAGKQFELMMYPKNRHSVRDDEQLAHLRKLMTQFVIDNL